MTYKRRLATGRRVLKSLFPSVRNTLATAIEVVVFLFAAFGGFLRGVAPPEEADSKFAVGIASLLCLCLLLGISALLRLSPLAKYYSIVIAVTGVLFVVALVAAFVYKYNLGRLLFAWP